MTTLVGVAFNGPNSMVVFTLSIYHLGTALCTGTSQLRHCEYVRLCKQSTRLLSLLKVCSDVSYLWNGLN